MRRRRWLALVLVVLVAAIAVTLLWRRDDTHEDVVSTSGPQVVGWPVPARSQNYVVTAIRPDGRVERVQIVPFNLQPTFWEWIRSWLGF
jgi:hypothetical protein